MFAPISIHGWPSLAILLYTFWDAPRWYKTPVHSVVISAITYGPVHFITAQWSPPPKHYSSSSPVASGPPSCTWFASPLNLPYVPATLHTSQVDPQIAAATKTWH